jgi:uncharacterized protein
MRWRGGRRGGGIEDRRGRGGGGLVGGGLGVGALALIGYLLFGIDPQLTTSVLNQFEAGSEQPGEIGSPEDEAGQFVDVILTSTTDVWSQLLPGYRAPGLVLYEQGTGTACGYGQAAYGPFYCPADRSVYLDLSFWQVMERQLGARGEFARAYVLGHEVGHHIQTLDGTADRVRAAQARAGGGAAANRYSVALELQADCYAGVWAHHAGRVSGGAVALEAGDLEAGLNAAAAIGDDRLQGEGARPETFTHGTSEQRSRWLRRGYEQGDPAACDTFSGPL